MKQGLFFTVLLVAAFGIAYCIFTFIMPDYIKAGGPLVILLIMLSIMLFTFILERLLTLNKARGKESVDTFIRKIYNHTEKGNIHGAIELCDKQQGSCASILRAGFAKFKVLMSSGTAPQDHKETMDRVKHAIDEAMMLEVPLLEKNLVAISTIASISTLVGLTGTTLGMIRSFKALAKSGAPDAIALSLGISEALINTAGGLICAITGIVAYNYFVTRIDNFTYLIDEASYSIIQTLDEKLTNR